MLSYIKKGTHHIVNLTNRRFGKLVARKHTANSRWLCDCDCGNQVIVRMRHLVDKRQSCCGCTREGTNRSLHEIEDYTNKIVDYLQKHPKSTSRNLADYLKVNPKSVGNVLSRMRIKCLVKSNGYNTDGFRQWSITQPEDPLPLNIPADLKEPKVKRKTGPKPAVKSSESNNHAIDNVIEKPKPLLSDDDHLIWMKKYREQWKRKYQNREASSPST